MWMNSKQKQILLYLYDLKDTPTRGVGPDPRLTIQCIAGSLGIDMGEAQTNLGRLIERAYVRRINLEFNTYFYLTQDGAKEVEKKQTKWIKARLGSEKIFLEGGMREQKGN
jgi:DNA-binding MarR family transcriptional regulator